ncbi:ATP-binding protein [Pimelobacter simplex]|uniref:ATP-binding protein n=1 Tax=Nocardioides simplex TaxID=2045 RepID=UPI00214FFA9E|nr:ATP-binding protein [Pimelobacter simplex]UUW92501.1 ATP-binding protein [Pimelobacter simplex]UUW96329.1 ATP-binding protein [Pimelobacter simplex]
MDVRIGTTADGHAAGFDTSSTRPLVLVGDVGRGKTTTARYLTRWWLANTRRHAHVFAPAPSEWADLRCEPEHPDQLQWPVGHECPAGTCLVVVDDIDLADDHHIYFLPLGRARTILTSNGAHDLADRPLPGDDVVCLGLVQHDYPDPAEAAVLEGQGRLDWPIGTVAVIPDQRGPKDFPCHRWQAPESSWMAVAR